MIKEVRNFANFKVIIRELNRNDLKRVKEFQKYINELIEEDAKILHNKKLTSKEEEKWLKNELNQMRRKKEVVLIAEHNEKIIGICSVEKRNYRQSHVAEVDISIKKEFRGIGLGKYLMKKAMEIAKARLKPKFFILHVFANNFVAISLYKKLGFKEVARIPKLLQYKGKLVDDIIMMKKA